MKKLIAISVVFALVAGVAFADTANGISVQGWGRAAFVPIRNVSAPQTDGKTADGAEGENYAGVGASWGGDKARIDFRINGDSEFVGFQTQFSAENGIGIEDNMHIWTKPFGSDILKLSAGKISDDTLRGKIGNLNGGFENFVMGNPAEEDQIFTRFGTYNLGDAPHGYMLSSAPIDGLYIGLMVNGAQDPWWNGGVAGATPAAVAYQYMQIGLGYQIEGIGHVRVQYLGGWSGTLDPTNKDQMKYFASYGEDEDGNPTYSDASGKRARIEFAFALTAVDNLLIDLGFRYGLPLEIKDATAYSDGIGISLGANFNADALGIGARVDVTGLSAYADGRGVKDDDSQDGMNLVFRLVPTYNLDAATIGLDVAFKLVGDGTAANGDSKEDGYNQLGFGLFVAKGLGSGGIKAGLSYTLAPTNKDGAQGSGVFQIPVILEYAFF